MVCRALLLYVASDLGAESRDLKSFKSAVTWLQKNSWLPPKADRLADEVRKRGNEANHELRIFNAEDCTLVLGFTQQILRNAYEIASLMPPEGVEVGGEEIGAQS